MHRCVCACANCATWFTVPEAPLMQLQALNATSLLVLWERPEVLGAELIGYKLAFRKDGDSAASTIILTGERTRHTLIKLGKRKTEAPLLYSLIIKYAISWVNAWRSWKSSLKNHLRQPHGFHCVSTCPALCAQAAITNSVHHAHVTH